MKNKFIYSNSNKRYHTYDYYLNQKYGGKVAKIALNAGFSCPHIINHGKGCIFCAVHNKDTILLTPEKIRTQFQEKKQALSKKWKSPKYIAYFQSGSNTFADLEDLKKVYESVLNTENLAGIDIATRPDCITREIAAYLAELKSRENIDVSVELGLQTCHDATAQFINRGYTLEVFESAYKILADYNISVTIHIINSLPLYDFAGGLETPEMMLKTAEYIANLKPLPLGVKIHQLYIAENTGLYDLYKASKIKLLSKEEYINTVIMQLEILPPQVVIMRLTGDPELNFENPSAVPEWVQKKFTVINDIDKLMLTRGTYQGRLSGYKYMKDKNVDVSEDYTLSLPHRPANNASLTNMLSMAKRLLDISIKENGIYADFTMGKGGDILYIKKACPSAKIYAFDIQAQAVGITRTRLEEENCFDENILLINDSHANLKQYIREELDGAIFNLGYLPGSDKSVTTQTESTFSCLTDALEILKPGGVIVVSVYPGHDEGAREGEKILAFAENLDRKEYDCLYHRLINIPEAPFIIAFQKKQIKQKKQKES